MTRKSVAIGALGVLVLFSVGACSNPDADLEAIASLDSLNVIDENNLNSIMLDYADPNQAVTYFQSSLVKDPTRLDFKQGYAASLLRAGRAEEAILAYASLESSNEITATDRLIYAEAFIQTGEWQDAKVQLDRVPPTLETYDRYRLEAMVADFQKQWARADSYYQSARELTTRPSPILNNWGMSKIARGDKPAAEDLFLRAISFDSTMFSAKNNLAITRASRKVYELPIVPMTSSERAQLMHNIALQAIRNGDVDIGRGLLEQAVDTSPRHFPEAVAKLEALNQTVLR